MEIMTSFRSPADILGAEISEKMTDFLPREIQCLNSVRSLWDRCS